MFSDEGIKKYLLKKFVPIFNNLINHYLTQYKLNVKVDFDEYFDYTINAADDVGDSYGALSGGQRNRINISVLFALNDLISIIGNFKCNVLFIDEFIDSAVDNEGLLDSIKILKEMAERNNKSIFLVSHKAGKNTLELMDRCYKVFDYHGFSIINQIEISDEINNVLDEQT
jgi:DNA repair exonuclease SbcCD ATPase subunit